MPKYYIGFCVLTSEISEFLQSIIGFLGLRPSWTGRIKTWKRHIAKISKFFKTNRCLRCIKSIGIALNWKNCLFNFTALDLHLFSENLIKTTIIPDFFPYFSKFWFRCYVKCRVLKSNFHRKSEKYYFYFFWNWIAIEIYATQDVIVKTAQLLEFLHSLDFKLNLQLLSEI